MKSNAERMNLVFARAKKIKYCRETKKLKGDKKAEFLQSGNRPAFRSFAVLHRVISDIVQKCGGCRLLRCNSAD